MALITDRSPSYERAREEHRHPSPVGEAQAVAVMNRLIEVEIAAARVFTAAMRQAQDAAFADELRTSAAAHDARRAQLTSLVEARGGSPPREGEGPSHFEVVEREIWHAVTDDTVRAALQDLRAELADTYATAKATADLPESLRAILAD